MERRAFERWSAEQGERKGKIRRSLLKRSSAQTFKRSLASHRRGHQRLNTRQHRGRSWQQPFGQQRAVVELSDNRVERFLIVARAGQGRKVMDQRMGWIDLDDLGRDGEIALHEPLDTLHLHRGRIRGRDEAHRAVA